MLNIDIRIQNAKAVILHDSLLGMLNIDIRIPIQREN